MSDLVAFQILKHCSGCEECTGGYQTLMSQVGISLVPLYQ
jgi:hypothetical protein